MSRRSSSRKEDLVLKVKKKDVMDVKDDDDDDDDNDEDDKTEDDPEVVSLSDASSEEVIAPKKQRNVSYNKAAFSMPDDISKLMNRVLCTACGKQLNPMNHGAVRKHPWLKVITCKKCYKFLKSGPFTRDEDGTDEQCRWCGDGGRLYGCDYCNNCFCRSCIKRNIGRTEAAEMESEDSTKAKWKCYMCQPKKIKTLQENCNKILDYIKKEEEKEKQREERAKQREREKAQAKKEKKQNNKEEDKKDRRNSLPIPKLKNDLNESREKTQNKTCFPAPKPKHSIVIEDSPEKTANKLATAKSHLAPYQSRPGDGVTQVQKVGNGVTQVTVGPKAKMPVNMPYKDGMKLNNTQGLNRTSSLQSLLAPKPIQPLPVNRPNLLGALTNQFNSAPSNVVILDKKGITQVAKINDIRALKEQIVPFNVETITEKLSTVAQAFSLTLNHVKTDLAIAKISSSNLFNSRSSAAYSVKTGLDVFFNNMRDIFNVQITTASPSDEPITIDDGKSDKGLPNGNDSSIDTDSVNGSVKKEVKEEIKKESKKEIEMDTNGPIDELKIEVKTEKIDIEEKMETDDGNSKKLDNSNKNIKGDNKDKSDENNDMMENSDTEKNNDKNIKSKGDSAKITDSSTTSRKSDKSSTNVEPDKCENTAAELDILKELADEINEANEKDENMEDETEPRRSSKRKKSQQDCQDDNEGDEAQKSSDTEQTPKRFSRRRDEKESQDEKKNQKSTKTAQEKEKDKEEETAEGNSEPEQDQRRSSRRKLEEKEKGKDNKDSNDSKDTKDAPDKKFKDKSKNDTKNSKSSLGTKSMESNEADEPSVNGDDNEDISSDSDSSVSSVEFGKRRTRRKKKDEDKAKSESKSKGAKSDKTKSKESSEKTDKKDKKTDKKESRSTRSKRSSEDKEEEYQSDSSNFDADLEKDIKSLSKDTKLTRSSRRAGKDESDATEKTKDGKRTLGKGKKDKNMKEDSVEESDNSQDKSEEEDVDPPPESKGGKKTRGKNKKDESDNEDDDDADDESKDDEEEEEENEEVDEDDLSPAQLRKLRAAQKKEEESDYEDMVASDNSDSEDPEVSFPKLSTPKKGKNKKGKGKAESVTIESDDSDFVTPKKNKKRKLKSDLLDAKVSDSDSDVGAKKKKKGRGKKRKKEEDEDDEPDPEDEIYSDDEKKKKGKGKRKRIKKVVSSSDEEKEKQEEGEEEDENDLEDTPGGAHKRKKIRKVMANKKLADSTKEARKIEEERRKRIEERQKEFNAYVEVEGGEEEEEVPEGTEREKKEEDNSIAKILGTAKKVPVTTKCVLDMEKDTKKVLVEIDKTLVRKLKPHQVEAVRFMYNCCVESVERMKKEEGAGCILAHCMGLGKTLSVISFLHTMLSSTKLTKTTKCLVVCPLNTVLNWVNEFEIWLEDVDYEIEVYEMSKVKQNYERAQMLREWHEGGAGVMILGYDMYRNLVNGSHCKNKKQKATFFETLADPGPDIVVCDEGHVLKNDVTSLSKAMMKIKTKRRVVLTGTPLQNNLGEYHCMVSFVKPNLLGTRKEFSNRFVNPITNGQCSDSTGSDVKLMKRRAHILHEMLAGCVQRKDYSALTKFLPPKFEYVVSVRMSPLQCTLYENYLKEVGIVQNEEIHNKGGRLFRDYQALMRIWTHPWVLKLDEIRQENKRTYDSEDSFIDDETDEEGEDSFISGSTTSESDADFNPKSKKKKKSKGKKGKKKGSDSDSDSDVKEVDEENEVIKKWSSKRRGNEEGAGSSWMQDMGYATGPKEVSDEWWAQYVKEEDEFKIELSGKLSLMFEILRMCEDIGDKVLIFSQSLLSLDIIEDFLHYVDESNNKEENEEGENKEKKDGETSGTSEGEKKEKTEEEKKKEEQKKEEEKKKEKYAQYGKSWTVGADYFRMDGSTSSQQRKAAQDSFNDPENFRARLFLISTKAGSLGINLVAANRVIIFDASWNPSHDIQSIFRVYRFGQIKPVYVYRFLAQGTMEEKIYERQVTKQSLSQRVVDEHQIERHFSANDLQELYKFQPDKLDDPDKKERPLPMLPKDHMLAELMSTQKDWIVTFHEHDSLLENIVEQELSEEEKKAAWEDYENEKKGLNTAYPMYANMMSAQQRMNSALEFQNLVLQGQANLGQEAVLQIVQDLKARFPTLPPEVFSQRVQAVLRQVLTQRIMQQSDFQRRQLDQQKMAELNRLNQIKQQIQQQQAMLNSQQRSMGVGGNYYNSLYGVQALPSSGFSNNLMARAMGYQTPAPAHSSPSSSQTQQKSSSKTEKK